MFENVITSVGIILLLAFSHAVGYKCLSCASIARPQDCDKVTTCGPHQKCFTQVLVSTTHYVRYNLGCLDDMKCATPQGRKRGSIKETKIEEFQGNNDTVRDIDSQWDSSNMDIVICTSCCDTELCNIKGCGSAGLPVDSGPVCYSCNQETDPNTCSRIEYCGLGEACHLSTKIIGVDVVYQSGCIHRQLCHDQGVLDIGAYQLVGRRRRGVDMTSRLKRSVFCNKCCTANLCNLDNCSSLTHPHITLPPTTILAPVNGGWNDWSQWNLCSVTCGEGTHYRVRVCNNPRPSHGGAMCSGTNKETQPCKLPICSADGQWSLWATWSVCSHTCGTGGTRNRQRICNNPTPTAGGKYCLGEPYETQRCDGLSDPHVIKSAQNFTEPTGSNVLLLCLVPGSTSLQQVPSIRWTAPQTIGHPTPTNFAQARDGSLYIAGLTLENSGPYSCTATTACGTYTSATFWVNIQ